jgi:LPS export ABC transporter protein LptC
LKSIDKRMLRCVVFFWSLLVVPGIGLCADLGVPASSAMASSSEPSQMNDFNFAGYGKNGEKTWEVEGASMDMVGPDIKIRDITARMFGGQENLVVTADNGNFDRDNGIMRLTDNVRAVTDTGTTLTTNALDWTQKDGRISTDQKVNIDRGNMNAVGSGLEAKPDMKIAKFEKDVICTIDEQKKAKPVSPDSASGQQSQPFGGKGKMVITCDGPMELNYEKQYAVFNKNVKVETEGDQGSMIADKMTVRFNQAARQIDTINAEGHVKIIRGESTSLSDSAIFSNTEKKVILTGRPKLVLFTDMGKKDEEADAGETKNAPSGS